MEILGCLKVLYWSRRLLIKIYCCIEILFKIREKLSAVEQRNKHASYNLP